MFYKKCPHAYYIAYVRWKDIISLLGVEIPGGGGGYSPCQP